MTSPMARRGWAEARALAWRERRLLAAGLGLMLLNRAAALVLPASSKLLVDQVLMRGRPELLPVMAAGVCLALLVESATGFAMTRLLGAGAQRVVTTLRRTTAGHVLRLPVSYFDRTHTGTIVSRIVSDADQVQHAVGSGLVQLLSGLLTAAVAFAVLGAVEWRLACAVMLVLVGATFGLGHLFGKLDADYRSVSDSTAGLAARLGDALGGIRALKVSCAERAHAHLVTRAAHEVHRAMMRALSGTSRLSAASTLVSGLVGLALLVIGGHAVMAGRMTLGDLALFVLLVGALTTPLTEAAAYAGEVGRAAAALGRLLELRASPTEAQEDRRRSPVRRVIGHIAFEQVSYAYAPHRRVLHDIDIDMPAGSTTALIGRSGAGKSTICRLVLAFDRPSSGRVLIDGCDLSLLRRGDYRRHLGVVLQESTLLDGSVAENISAGRAGATMLEVRRAGRLAHCDEFVESLPAGYETPVGERGARLSGGQRQRVAIARAILADPRILILDEATSSLDEESERLVRQALEVLRGGRTTVVIAHRASTVEGADQVVVLDAGRVVARVRAGSIMPAGAMVNPSRVSAMERHRAAPR